MNFISLLYALFLFCVVGMYWSVGRSRTASARSFIVTYLPFSHLFRNIATHTLRLWILLIVSLAFYATLQAAYIPLLLGIIGMNFFLGKAMANTAIQGGLRAKDSSLSNQEWEKVQQTWNQRSTLLLGLGISLNVLILLGFKYIPFLLTSIAAPLNLPVAMEGANWISDRLIAPLGISFFTFECIAYLVDVYRGAPASHSFVKFASYKLFFPKLIAGPITRYHYFAAQLKGPLFPAFDQFTEGIWLIACGAIKKALIADRLAIFVDLTFGNLERAGSGDLWLAILAYALQLYLDFSGYVDIARGSALLLGFDLPINFDFPYFTTSIAQFWRRWHMSLGDWLRNYLYFPLGGSRKGLARTCLNLFLVMLIAGIWHGAAWGFIVWGCLHGIALAIHRLSESISKRYDSFKAFWNSFFGVMLAWFITQFMVFISWVFFRLPNVNQASLVLQRLWGYSGDIQFTQKVYVESLGIDRPHLAIAIAILFAGMSLIYFFMRGLKLQLNWPIKIVLVPLSLFIVWLLAPEGGLPYIYFDF